jgi:hypothetical protein
MAAKSARERSLSERRPSALAPLGLVIGAVLGLAGSFAPSASLRGLAWGVDGIALIVAAALLAIHFVQRAHAIMAAGFLVFIVGQTLVVSVSAIPLEASVPVFGAGAGLWAAALLLISAPDVMPFPVRVVGGIAALLFGAIALQIFAGHDLNPLSQPLPFFAYPTLVLTLGGWAWWCRQ